jgi:ATP-dependent exoDNAse (exonuclease V) beta subunit
MKSSHIKFDEKTHIYTNINTGERYISGTQLLGKYKEKFDSDAIAERTAKKRGLTKDQILSEWKESANIATTKGTAIHETIQSMLMRIPEKFHSEYSIVAKKALVEIEKVLGNTSNITSEMLIWNDKLKIASQSDLVQRYTPPFCKHEIINIIDYKTNKAIDTYNKYNTYMLEPLNNLMECEYNIYSLQLSLYAYLLEKMYPQAKIGKLAIMWLNPHTEEWKTFAVPYMKYDVIRLLQDFKSSF